MGTRKKIDNLYHQIKEFADYSMAISFFRTDEDKENNETSVKIMGEDNNAAAQAMLWHLTKYIGFRATQDMKHLVDEEDFDDNKAAIAGLITIISNLVDTAEEETGVDILYALTKVNEESKEDEDE